MPVKKETSGRRSVEADVEVSGTPEQVWQAIASGRPPRSCHLHLIASADSTIASAGVAPKCWPAGSSGKRYHDLRGAGGLRTWLALLERFTVSAQNILTWGRHRMRTMHFNSLLQESGQLMLLHFWRRRIASEPRMKKSLEPNKLGTEASGLQGPVLWPPVALAGA